VSHDPPPTAADPGCLPDAARVPLLAVAHGTRDAAGLATTAHLLDLVRALRPGLPVELGYVDVAEPRLADTLARLSGPVVVVPLLLGTGFHVRHDIPAALAAAPQVTARVAAALGPDPRLAEVLHERLAAAWRPQDCPHPVDKSVQNSPRPSLSESCEAIVLAAAGSTDPAANADAAHMADLLHHLTGRPVIPSYLCASSPTPAEAVAALRADGIRNIAVSGYLMTPGYFARKASDTGATTAAPLGAHPTLARLILSRYDAAIRPDA
jgi:sirohydrochlorin ferrochelatase